MKLYEYTATMLSDNIKKGKLSSKELVLSLSDRIKEVDDKIGA